VGRGEEVSTAAAALRRYRCLLEANRPYAAHEALETLWRSPQSLLARDEVARALIQWAAAYVHRARGHPEGARTLRTRAQTRLETAAADATVRARWGLLGIDVAALAAAVRGWPEDPLLWPPATRVFAASASRAPRPTDGGPEPDPAERTPGPFAWEA